MNTSIFGEDQDVIHVNHHPPFIDHVTKEIVHHSLEGRGGVAESEEHDSGFEQAMGTFECSFPLVTFLDAHVVVPRS